MTEPVSSRAIEKPTEQRRTGPDRRTVAATGRRVNERPSLLMRVLGIAGRDLVMIAATLGAIVFTVRHTHPIFANQPTVAAALTHAVPAIKAALAAPPKDTGEVARIEASPQFKADKTKFASDLVRTGRMSQARADSIAYYAVREAYVRGIPPAVIFGVMLTENALFVSGAMSNVGAVGLMQVYPKVWLKALSAKFGKDLASDSTNLKYGIYILKQYIKSDSR